MPSVPFELFDGISPTVAAEKVRELPRRECTIGEVLLREGELNNRVFLVEAGKIEVWKGPPGRPEGVLLATLSSGACFGEIYADHAAPSSATLIASQASVVRLMAFSDLPPNAGMRETVALNLARTLVGHLARAHATVHAKHEREIGALQVATAAAGFITRMLVALAVYVLSLPFLAIITPLLPSNSIISFVFILVFGLVVVDYMKHHPEVRQSHWYMTLAHWPAKLGRGLIWTVPPLLVFVAIKLGFMHARHGAMPFIDPMEAIKPGAPMNWPVWASFAVIYTALCFAQEFIRCAVQGTLEAIAGVASTSSHWKAIIISDLVYATLHVHLGASFAVQAFIAGLFFGYEFYRERSYLAVAFSHAIVGFITVFVAGIPR